MAQQLSRRLESVLELLHPCAVLADVGTDHALLPVAAVLRGLAGRAFAVDLREAPLAGARAHIEQAGLVGRVMAVRGDGLLAVPEGRPQAVVMAGMSADSMLRVLDAAPHVLQQVTQLIVQPNQNVERVRAWAKASGWHLQDERMLEERGQFFSVCSFLRARGEDPAYLVPGWTEAALCSVGPWLLARRDAVALRWAERQRARLSHWVERGVSRLTPELELWEAACRAMRPAPTDSVLPS